MKTLRLLPAAVADLDGIWLHIAADNPTAADAMIDLFTQSFESLRRNPLIGPACPELAPDLRRFPVRNHVVFYSVRGRNLVVERVLHGARDIDALFE